MFITIEGIDGSGKTTLVNSLRKIFNNIHFTREPTDKFQLANLKTLSTPSNSFYNFFLFTYDRLEHQEEINGYKNVICDRYLASSIAYEGPMIEGLFGDRKETVLWMMEVSKMLKLPDMIIYLDANLDVALERIRNSRKNLNFRGKQLSILEEREGLKAIQDYYEYFLGNMKMFTQKQIKIEKIDANSSMEDVLYKAENIINKTIEK
ncbi:dTMP kinase [Ferroplasma acidiphilum]|jgi:dTMP kinase|uniref:Probable thymidylate kinase n=1 Tax=Ferroplasma acidiphilum TaxID=74969 RepID=A0A1V0N1H9_9ARCH|nr:dTMP kinase [Ferroplasma acidiphilum]ARD83955.1 thymidylate kinase [Ferroplasma acidiphilum]MCL4349404.1 dTMP kinase [Candidatus Thermoplasmatota archaeon]NOL60321.1 dTMP kinase [Ferroplasma acidiphilum]WMT52857.1 MAG: dTMP kinase [Ferroplasma acidiphilum]